MKHGEIKSSVIWDITPYSPLKKSSDFSEEHVTSIFRVKVKANQDTSMKQVASKALLCNIFLQNVY
jgi:hypothetical protein